MDDDSTRLLARHPGAASREAMPRMLAVCAWRADGFR